MRRQLVAGPGQTIAAAPLSLDQEARDIAREAGCPDGITDGLVGWWLLSTSEWNYTGASVCDCPFCYGPLRRSSTRPAGRAIYKIRNAVADPGTVEFMMDVLPDHLDILGCEACSLAFTQPFVKETHDAVATC